MTNPNAVPLLSVEDAHILRAVTFDSAAWLRPKLDAIASGDAVVIPRITREALREALGYPIPDDAVFWTTNQFIDALKRHGIEVQP